jgi:hypothetical protein
MTTPTPPPTGQPPALWNPNAAANWSLLFTPAFGAYLHARNAEALGRTDEAKANKVWSYVSLAYLGFVFVSAFIPAIPEGLFRLAGLALLLGWYFSLAKKQIRYVRETYRGGYEQKRWTKPLLIGFGSLIGSFIVFFVIAVAEELVFGSQ